MFGEQKFVLLKMFDISRLPKPLPELDVLKFEPSNPVAGKAPILICHGLTSSKNNWVDLGKRIANATGRITYAFDCRCVYVIGVISIDFD